MLYVLGEGGLCLGGRWGSACPRCCESVELQSSWKHIMVLRNGRYGMCPRRSWQSTELIKCAHRGIFLSPNLFPERCSYESAQRFIAWFWTFLCARFEKKSRRSELTWDPTPSSSGVFIFHDFYSFYAFIFAEIPTLTPSAPGPSSSWDSPQKRSERRFARFLCDVDYRPIWSNSYCLFLNLSVFVPPRKLASSIFINLLSTLPLPCTSWYLEKSSWFSSQMQRKDRNEMTKSFDFESLLFKRFTCQARCTRL